MKERYLIRRAARLQRIASGKRNPTDYPVPAPSGPYSGNVAPLTFDSYRAARQGTGQRVVLRLFRKFGADGVKPHRNSVGLIWNGRPYWWSSKGYYRLGIPGPERRPLQHLVWERHHRRRMPARHEIFFRDRNHNNFDPANLELMDKGELHLRCVQLGEVPQITLEQRKLIASKRWTRHSRKQTERLLQQFNTGGTAIKFLGRRKEVINHGPKV